MADRYQCDCVAAVTTLYATVSGVEDEQFANHQHLRCVQRAGLSGRCQPDPTLTRNPERPRLSQAVDRKTVSHDTLLVHYSEEFLTYGYTRLASTNGTSKLQFVTSVFNNVGLKSQPPVKPPTRPVRRAYHVDPLSPFRHPLSYVLSALFRNDSTTMVMYLKSKGMTNSSRPKRQSWEAYKLERENASLRARAEALDSQKLSESASTPRLRT